MPSIVTLFNRYLNRRRHAFIFATTFGCFGLGVVLDLFLIPSYVRQANAIQCVEEKTEVAAASDKAEAVESKEASTPCPLHKGELRSYFCVSCQTAACAKCCIVGKCKGHTVREAVSQQKSNVPRSKLWMVVEVFYAMYVALFFGCLVPKEDLAFSGVYHYLASAGTALGASLGSWVICCAGGQTVDFLTPTITTIVVAILAAAVLEDEPSSLQLSCFAVGMMKRTRKYKIKTRREMGPILSVVTHFLGMLLFAAVVCGAAYNCGTVMIQEGDLEVGPSETKVHIILC